LSLITDSDSDSNEDSSDGDEGHDDDDGWTKVQSIVEVDDFDGDIEPVHGLSKCVHLLGMMPSFRLLAMNVYLKRIL